MLPRRTLSCRHAWAEKACPYCGYELIRVIATGFLFCSNHEMICDYEEEGEA